ncbi:MAG: hypothetical protein KatS3mg123_0557 [Burkholderiales bacterium]|nr:MAG: hypothetical protein KatS3mg123_0557 [Burkholderiales bacterium]
MMIHSAAPVFDASGRLAGVLHGGVLLNRNLDFVDNINSIVYREGSLPLGSKGTATLFLDDVRIATNVRLFQGRAGAGHPGVGGSAQESAGGGRYLARPGVRGQRLVRLRLRARHRRPRPAGGHAVRGLPGSAFRAGQASRPGGDRRPVLAGGRAGQRGLPALGAQRLPAPGAHEPDHERGGGGGGGGPGRSGAQPRRDRAARGPFRRAAGPAPGAQPGTSAARRRTRPEGDRAHPRAGGGEPPFARRPAATGHVGEAGCHRRAHRGGWPTRSTTPSP